MKSNCLVHQRLNLYHNKKNMLNRSFFEQRFKMIGNYTVFTQQLLGKGATANVYRGEHKLTKIPVAVKAIDLSKINDEASKSLLQNEKAALRCLSGPNLLKLEDIIQDHGFCFIVTSLCEGKTLKQYLKEQIILNEKQAMSIFRKIVSACQIFSQQCIIHRDLKPANIMIDIHGEIKIIDFGYCEIIRAQKVMKTFNVGSPSYMSPQAYLRTLYSEKSDSWALGIILFEMLHGQTLDKGMQIPLYFEKLRSGPQHLQSKLSKSISPQVIQIIKKSLQYLPADRTSLSNLKYQADVYHLKHQRQLSHPSSLSKEFVQPCQYSRQNQPIIHSAKVIVKSQHDQNRPSSKGFVSYEDFTKNRLSKQSIEKIQHKTSLQDFDAMSSRKNSQEKSQKIAVDAKLQRFLHNIVKQNDHSRPVSSDNIQNQHKPMHSAKQIGPHLYYPPLPPRKITVRFV